MNRQICAIAMTVLFAFSAAHAEKPDQMISTVVKKDRTMQISFNPIGGLFLARLGGAFSFKVSDRVALMIPFMGSYWPFSVGVNGSRASFHWWSLYTGFGARFYLGEKAFESGWYIEPAVLLGYVNFDDRLSAFGFDPWVLVGYGWVFDSGLTINLGLGLQYNYYSAKVADQPSWIGYPLPVLDASIGYAW